MATTMDGKKKKTFFASNLCHIRGKIYSLFALTPAHVSVFNCSCLSIVLRLSRNNV